MSAVQRLLPVASPSPEGRSRPGEALHEGLLCDWMTRQVRPRWAYITCSDTLCHRVQNGCIWNAPCPFDGHITLGIWSQSRTSMNITDKLLSSALATTNALNAIFVGTLLVALYMIQRGFMVELNLRSADLDALLKTQVVVSNLSFSFLAMSLLWPIAIASLCLVFSKLAQRHAKILSRLSQLESSVPVSDLTLADPFYLFNVDRQKRSARWLWSFLELLPLLALGLHGAMTALGALLAWHEQAVPKWLLYKAPFQLFIAFFAIPFALSFRRAVRMLRGFPDA